MRKGGPRRGPPFLMRASLLLRAALLAHPHRDVDRGAVEAELLAQPALDEAPVARLDEPGGEEHEPRRLGAGLGAEEDARLLAAPDRVRVGGDQLTEEG